MLDTQRAVFKTWSMTKHAAERAVEMGLTPEEIRAAVEEPERWWVSPTYGKTNQTRGRITVALGELEEGTLNRKVITILWATQEAWRAAYRSGGTAAGRPVRDLSHLPSAHRGRRRRAAA
ncbi:hypothetical protein [Cellulosimicrobium sp. TH-20]|uniref:hypothetical protein n=1 Tax=Cellulosimicrobium sp. TH-20 TaxID=1980001 RepID=UPI0011A692E1|nr:hypothetical protein [Cellulosimicrobium sp. TH-20]